MASKWDWNLTQTVLTKSSSKLAYCVMMACCNWSILEKDFPVFDSFKHRKMLKSMGARSGLCGGQMSLGQKSGASFFKNACILQAV